MEDITESVQIFDLNNAKAILRQHMVACQMAKEYLAGQKTPMDDLFRMYKKDKLDEVGFHKVQHFVSFHVLLFVVTVFLPPFWLNTWTTLV